MGRACSPVEGCPRFPAAPFRPWLPDCFPNCRGLTVLSCQWCCPGGGPAGLGHSARTSPQLGAAATFPVPCGPLGLPAALGGSGGSGPSSAPLCRSWGRAMGSLGPQRWLQGAAGRGSRGALHPARAPCPICGSLSLMALPLVEQ